MPLYNLVRSASYDRIIAIETSLTTRDVSVAEGHLGCLQVTKVNGAVPLLQGDWFVSSFMLANNNLLVFIVYSR